MLVGALSVIRPVRILQVRTRRRGATVLVGGVMAVLGACLPVPSLTTVTGTGSALDDFAPAFHFREHHETLIDAPAADVFAAIQSTTASEIALFQTFTWIRRFGRPGAESILNAPEHLPILDVATRTTFLKLAERPAREVVIGSVVIAPAGFRRRDVATPDQFKTVAQPGFAVATFNFMIAEEGALTRLTTETRVVATDNWTLRRFTAYWRVIYPGSAILRMTWLQAIKKRAEGGTVPFQTRAWPYTFIMPHEPVLVYVLAPVTIDFTGTMRSRHVR